MLVEYRLGVAAWLLEAALVCSLNPRELLGGWEGGEKGRGV